MTAPVRAALIAVLATFAGALAPSQALAFGEPSVFFDEITGVTATQATFKGRADHNEIRTAVWFRVCKLSECPADPQKTPGPTEFETTRDEYEPSEFSRPFPVSVTFGDDPSEPRLEPNTQYRVTMYADNDAIGGSEPYPSQTRTFTTPAAPPPPPGVAPEARTAPATNLTASGANLNGVVVPGTSSGASQPPSTVYFRYGEGAAFNRTTPAQQVPAGDRPVDVSAAVTGLRPNVEHRFRVVVERDGRRVEGAEERFTLSAPPSCTDGATYQTALKVERLVLTGCFLSAGGQHVGIGEVRVNGLTLTPSGAAPAGDAGHDFAGCTTEACRRLQSVLDGGGHRVYVDVPGRALGTKGAHRARVNQIGVLHTGDFDFTRVDFTGSASLFRLGVDASVELFGFPIVGLFEFTPRTDGTSVLHMVAGLPGTFGGARGETDVAVTNAGDPRVDRLRIDVGTARLKIFDVGQLSFLYDRLDGLWRGSAKVTIPTRPAPVQVGATVEVRRGQFSELAGEVDDLNRPIGKGIFLQKIGARFGLDPFRLGGTIGLSAGPSVKVGTTNYKLLAVDADLDFRDASSRRIGENTFRSYPPGLTLKGTLLMLNIPLGKASATFYFSNFAWIELEGELGVDFRVDGRSIASILGTVDGSLYGTDFELGGDVRLSVVGRDLLGATARVTTKGAAACAFVEGFVFGAWYRWSDLAGGTFFDVCGVSKLRSLIGTSSVTRAKGGRSRPLPLPADRALTFLRFRGAAAPPAIRLLGPGGRVIDMPAGGRQSALVRGSHFIAREPATRSTLVQLRNTGSGAWRYQVLGGRVTAVDQAERVPLPRISAKVVRRGGRSELVACIRPQPGHRVTFVEGGPGVPPRTLLSTTGGGRFTARFTPSAVPQRARRITAIVEQSGRPRTSAVVARFAAPAPPRLTAPRNLTARRSGGAVAVRWSPAAAAERYEVLVLYRDGEREMLRTGKPALRLTGELAREITRIQVRAVGADGQRSAAAATGPPR